MDRINQHKYILAFILFFSVFSTSSKGDVLKVSRKRPTYDQAVLQLVASGTCSESTLASLRLEYEQSPAKKSRDT